jgi:hypothetical protein
MEQGDQADKRLERERQMQLTTKNHYNPCFWTAHWNSDYLAQALRGQRSTLDARSQRVFVLNVKADKIYQQAVENVHYDKSFGLAEITPEDAKGFCQRHFPDEYEQFCKEMDAQGGGHYILDFENILTGLEQTPAYDMLLRVIGKGRIDSVKEKAFLASFALVQHLRSHAMMNSLVEFGGAAGRPKFEDLWMLKHFLSNTNSMFGLVLALTSGRWQFYRLEKDTFPLNDTPVLIQQHSAMVAISPRLLLEIDRTDLSREDSWISSNYIPKEKLEEFRRRTIGNTFREIIFGNKLLLEEWQQTTEFRRRHELMSNIQTYNEKVADYLGGELWKINAHGNALP